ncbi:MAG: hypothetical protein LBJ61_10755 [Deltaproteobacteria bacterium]|jgi:hypothetical protein|nr:hypothetical protein [Deltaproteobacteria bacterium]
MAQYIIVGVIVLAALGLAIYRIAFKPSCGCGCGAGGHKKGEKRRDPLAE